ncbi:MAG: SUMF1/EgtB/PvdO family nonheme iron enzyme [Pseudomonadota bacterium]
MLSGTVARLAVLLLCGALGCAGRRLATAPELSPAHPSQAAVAAAVVDAGPAQSPALDQGDAGAKTDGPRVASETNPPEATQAACPVGMKHVTFDYCPEQTRRCVDKEYDKPNHITICNRFAEEKPQCHAPRVALDFCIDEFEYPNRAGAKPPVMLNFYEASGLCAAEQKRLCYESEWVTACEGPDEKPFPYGYVRSSERCNFDNRWVDPHLDRLYAKDPAAQRAELARLDRSQPSGQKASCVSDYGVYDLTGNVDEWALADHDRPRERAKFAALKGGAWGHVRNACRPVTTSHVPEFRYYFIGFRCCADPRL